MKAVELIREAVDSGSRRVAAARMVGISMRTLQRWEAEGCREDQRCGPRGSPANALSEAERAMVVAVATCPTFRDLPPCQIVPILADCGVYVGSEASYYRILRHAKLLVVTSHANPAGFCTLFWTARFFSPHFSHLLSCRCCLTA